MNSSCQSIYKLATPTQPMMWMMCEGWPHHPGSMSPTLFEQWCGLRVSVVRRDLYGHYKGSTFFSVILNKDPEFWSGQGSNPRPPALQTSALPTEQTRRRLLKKRGISFNPTDLVSSYCISESDALTQLVSLGAFHLVKISGISGSAVNRTHSVGSSHWKIPRKSGKSKKVGISERNVVFHLRFS